LRVLCHRVEAYRAQNGLTQCHNGQQFGNLPVVCGAGAATCTKSALKETTLPPLQLVVTASWRRERHPIPPIVGDAGTRRRRCKRSSPREHLILQRGECSPPTSPRQVSPSRRRSEAVQRNNNRRRAKFLGQIHPQE
jgi:hypothetical protein